MISREEFLSGCLEGWTDAQRESPDWIDTTKADKKAMAKEAIEQFDKIYHSLSMVNQIAEDQKQWSQQL